jgi:hypothetical protein
MNVVAIATTFIQDRCESGGGRKIAAKAAGERSPEASRK